MLERRVIKFEYIVAAINESEINVKIELTYIKTRLNEVQKCYYVETATFELIINTTSVEEVAPIRITTKL